MKPMLLIVAMTITTIAGAVVANAQRSTAEQQAPFRFDFEQAQGPRGLGLEGYVYNSLPWRITNVRLRVDSLDANGTVTTSSWGWVLGNVNSGGRGYFYVPLSSRAAGYRPSVQSFDKVAADGPRLEAP